MQIAVLLYKKVKKGYEIRVGSDKLDAAMNLLLVDWHPGSRLI